MEGSWNHGLGEGKPMSLETSTEPLQFLAVEPPNFMVKEIDQILVRAVEEKASDVVFSTGKPVWTRIHGKWFKCSRKILKLTELENVQNIIARSPSSAAQISSGNDLDFRYEIQTDDRFRRLRFRVNTTACQVGGGRGIEMTFRSIPGKPLLPHQLSVEEGIMKAAFPIFGLVLVTGPVGSGKTTLLAALMRHSATTDPRRILTYEYPVEYDLGEDPDELVAPVTQTEIPVDLRGGWPVAVRNSLRRAGDIVLMGEARDRETISSLLEGSETGVATYSTSHTNGVVDTISRIVDVFPWEERDGMVRKMIANLRLVVNQRLFPNPKGGRQSVREYLEFTPDIRKELRMLPYREIVPKLDEFLIGRGQPLSVDARKKHAEGNLSDETLDQILSTVEAERDIAEKMFERRAS